MRAARRGIWLAAVSAALVSGCASKGEPSGGSSPWPAAQRSAPLSTAKVFVQLGDSDFAVATSFELLAKAPRTVGLLALRERVAEVAKEVGIEAPGVPERDAPRPAHLSLKNSDVDPQLAKQQALESVRKMRRGYPGFAIVARADTPLQRIYDVASALPACQLHVLIESKGAVSLHPIPLQVNSSLIEPVRFALGDPIWIIPPSRWRVGVEAPKGDARELLRELAAHPLLQGELSDAAGPYAVLQRQGTRLVDAVAFLDSVPIKTDLVNIEAQPTFPVRDVSLAELERLWAERPYPSHTITLREGSERLQSVVDAQRSRIAEIIEKEHRYTALQGEVLVAVGSPPAKGELPPCVGPSFAGRPDRTCRELGRLLSQEAPNEVGVLAIDYYTPARTRPGSDWGWERRAAAARRAFDALNDSGSVGKPSDDDVYDFIKHYKGPPIGHGARPDPATLPSLIGQVTLGNPAVSGTRGAEEIRQYARRKLPRILFCYEKELLIRENIGGVLVLEFEIDARGVASTSATKQSWDKRVSGCVAKALESLVFKRNKGASKVRYPMLFERVPNPMHQAVPTP